jgi:REP element-mobilizing transposase RayT
MPDHVHLLVEGMWNSSDLKRFAKMAKQRSGAAHALAGKGRLWKEGYWDILLRVDDPPQRFARYIVMNPVRAGLAQTPGD